MEYLRIMHKTENMRKKYLHVSVWFELLCCSLIIFFLQRVITLEAAILITFILVISSQSYGKYYTKISREIMEEYKNEKIR